MCISLALYHWKRYKKIIAIALSALCIAGLYLTFSRGAVMAIIVGLLIIALVRKDKLILGGFICILVVAPFLIPQKAKDFAQSVHYNPLFVLFNQDRISAWRNATNMVAHHPVIGVGVNTFSINYGTYKLEEHGDQITGSSFYAHNIFLQMAGETGLLGVSCFIWFLVSFFWITAGAYKRMRVPLDKVMLLGLIASVSAFLINGISETSLYYARVSMIFWLLIGCAIAVTRLKQEDCHAAGS